MKKTLLLASLMLGTLTGINAQETISFETAEGYTLGTLNGQNGWSISGGENDGTEITKVTVANDIVGHEFNALKFVSADSEPDEEIVASKSYTPDTNIFSITQRVYADGRDDDNGSDITIATTNIQNGETVLTSGITFAYDGSIEILFSYSELYNEYFYTPTQTTYEPNTWYEVKTTFNINAGTVEYYVNNELLRTVPFMRGTGVNAVAYAFDDYTTSYYIDDITTTAQTAGLNKATATKFSVYPNPATTVINVTNSSNALVNSISVTDLNGRTVKSSQFTGVANAQINIADLSAGMYMLNIISDKGSVTKKIVKN